MSVVTKTWNQPKPSKTTQNQPKRPKSIHQFCDICADGRLCDVAWLLRWQSCEEFSRPSCFILQLEKFKCSLQLKTSQQIYFCNSDLCLVKTKNKFSRRDSGIGFWCHILSRTCLQIRQKMSKIEERVFSRGSRTKTFGLFACCTGAHIKVSRLNENLSRRTVHITGCCWRLKASPFVWVELRQ